MSEHMCADCGKPLSWEPTEPDEVCEKCFDAFDGLTLEEIMGTEGEQR